MEGMLTTCICAEMKNVSRYQNARIPVDKQLGGKKTWMKMLRTEEAKREISQGGKTGNS